MSATTKFVGLVAGVSAVAAIGVAIAQGVPPNPYIANPALGAGQQSTHITSMGETGVPGLTDPVRAATITRQEEVAVVQEAPAPVAPAPVAAAPAPEPAPAPVIAAQTETAPPTAVMGAAPEPEPTPAPMRVSRNDRN